MLSNVLSVFHMLGENQKLFSKSCVSMNIQNRYFTPKIVDRYVVNTNSKLTNKSEIQMQLRSELISHSIRETFLSDYFDMYFH